VLAVLDVALLSDRSESAPLATTENGDAPVRPTANQLAQVCQYDEALPDFRLFDMLTSGRAAYEGSEGASGRMLKVFDPNCPHCATLHAAMKGTVAEHSDDTRFYYQPIALWDFSIPQVQAMYIARESGNEPFLRMMNLQLDGQRRGGIPVDTLVAYAAQIGLDEAAFRQEMEAGRFVNVIRSEQQMIGGAGVNSVPKLFVEGRAIRNTQATWSPECLNYYAEQSSARRR
jgi:predicted DsbA family dithiol-disulfide isomerase